MEEGKGRHWWAGQGEHFGGLVRTQREPSESLGA